MENKKTNLLTLLHEFTTNLYVCTMGNVKEIVVDECLFWRIAEEAEKWKVRTDHEIVTPEMTMKFYFQTGPCLIRMEKK